MRTLLEKVEGKLIKRSKRLDSNWGCNTFY